jgi:hypothetical protein
MESAKVEAMLNEAGVNWTNARILFRHINQFFWKVSLWIGTQTTHCFFWNRVLPTIDVYITQDDTKVRYWYKKPNELLKHQIAHIITADDVKNLQHLDFTVGGDHGKGRFRMTFKMLLRYSDKQSASKLFQIASVEYSKDDIVILNSTVLKPVGEGLKEVKDGGRFIVIAVDKMINVMNECTNEPKINAAKCLCHALCQKYEDAFASFAEKKVLLYVRRRWKVQK